MEVTIDERCQDGNVEVKSLSTTKKVSYSSQQQRSDVNN